MVSRRQFYDVVLVFREPRHKFTHYDVVFHDSFSGWVVMRLAENNVSFNCFNIGAGHLRFLCLSLNFIIENAKIFARTKREASSTIFIEVMNLRVIQLGRLDAFTSFSRSS